MRTVFFMCLLGWALSKDVGPYILKLVLWEKCGKKTDPIHFQLRLTNATSKLEGLYSGKIKFDVPVDDTLSGDVYAEVWGPKSGWQSNAFHTDQGGMCSFIKNVAPGYFDSLTSAIKAEKSCPIAQGSYKIDDWFVDTRLTEEMPELPYGEYRITVTYKKEFKVLGCARWLIDVIER